MITHTPPPQHTVYNSNGQGISQFAVNFKATGKNPKFVLINTKTEVVIPVVLPDNTTDFVVKLDLPKGEYKYTISEDETVVAGSGANLQPPTPLEVFFSVGKVVVIMGHSMAANNGERWVTDTRVRIVEDYEAKLQGKWRDETKYIGQRYRTCPEIWEENKNTTRAKEYEIGIWAILAQRIVEQENCNVAIVNTSMGGSSVKMWADEAMNRPFNHGFGATVQGVEDQNLYNSGIPYFHLENVLKHIVNTTGVSCVLVQHGENDMSTDSKTLAKYYQEVIETARKASNLPELPFVLAKSAWLLNLDKGHTQSMIDNVLGAIDVVLKDVPNTYLGPVTNLTPMSLRQLNSVDDEHWNSEGGKEVARLWSLVLTKAFFDSLATKDGSKGNIVRNPIVTANNELKYNDYEFPFIASMFALLLGVFLKVVGVKIPTYLIMVLGGSAFGGSYLVQYLLRKRQ